MAISEINMTAGEMLCNRTENMTDCSNSTVLRSAEENPLKLAMTVVLTITLVVIMFGVGCHIDLPDLWAHIRRPFGIAIGFLAQFGLLPLAAFGMGHALQLPPLQALGMLIMSCCPGGSTSNIFTYWMDGDVPLSVSMTTVNTALSAGMLPFNLWLYGREWSGTKAAIPYRNIGEAFAMVAVPVAGGLLVKWKFPKAAEIILKVGSYVGALSVMLTIGLMTALYPNMYDVSWQIYFAIIMLPSLAFLLGYVFAWIARMTPTRCRTVSLETGIQNFPLCMTLLALTYPKDMLGQLAIYPLLFGVFILVESALFVLLYRIYVHLRQRHKARNMTESAGDVKDSEKRDSGVTESLVESDVKRSIPA